jgi:PAS domain S-box-containing protein
MSEGLRILIVEGNPAEANFIHEMLPRAGPLHFEVEPVQKLSDALARLEKKDIDLVLLNLLLPDSQGLQTFHTLQKSAPEVPVIVLAGSDDHELAIAAVQHGAQDYLVKGQVSVRPLIRAVRYALARKKAEDALRQSEIKFRTLVTTLPQKIFIKGGDYHYLSVNENYARDLGLKTEEVAGKTDYDFYPKELADKYRADDRRIMRKGQTEEFDEKYLQDGREVWIHTFKTPVRDESGKITGVLGIFSDATARKQAEEALRESEERYRSLFEHMVEGFAHCRMIFENGEPKDWVYLSVNRAFEKLTGLKDVVGKRVTEVIPGVVETDPELFKIYARVSLTGKPEQFEMFIQALRQWFAISVYSPEKEFFVVVFDLITGRKKAEEALQQTHFCMENAGDGIFWLSPKGRLLYANKSACQRLGYTESELLGMNVFDLDPDFKPGDWEVHWEKLKRLGTMTFESHHRTKAGEVFPVEVNANCIQVGGRELNFAFTRDITERKQAEEAVRQSREEFKDLFDNAPVGFHEIDAEGRIVRVNNTELKMLGYSAGELLGQFVWKISTEEEISHQAVLAKLGGKLTPPTEGFERRLRRKDGSTFPVWINDRVLKLENGDITGIRSGIQDITERKRAEKELQERDMQLRLALNAARMGTWDWDIQTGRIACSSGHEALWGYAPGTFPGTSGAFNSRIHPDDVEGMRRAEQKALDGHSNYDHEYRVRWPDGTVRWVASLGQGFYGPDGRPARMSGVVMDITERKRMEAELTRERDLWRTLLDNSPDKIYFKDAQSRFIKSSKAQARQFGLNSADELVGKTDFDFFAEAHARPAFEDEQEIIRTGQPIIAKEEREVWNDGHVTWASSTKLPMRDSSGRITGIMGITRDITERKQVEADLEHERDLWRTLLDNSPDKIYFKDTQSRFVKCSKTMAVQFGVKSPDELVGKTDFDYFDVSHARPAFEDEQEIIRTGRPMIDKEEREEWKDGSVTWVSSTKVPWLDSSGKIIGIMGISRDITGRRQAEEAVRESERRFQTLAVISPVGIFRTDAQGQTTYVNPTWCEISGLPAAEALGVGWLRAVHPDDREKLAQAWQAAARAQSASKADYRFVHPDGNIAWVMGQAIPEKDGAGNAVGYVGTITDITARKQAEEALRESQAFYHSLVAQLPAGVFRKDPEGRFVFVSPGFCQLKGAKAEEFLGKTPREAAASEAARRDPAGLVSKYAAVGADHHRMIMQTGKPVELDEEYTLANGRKHFVRAVKIPVLNPDGKVIGSQGILFDITERKQAETALRDSEAFLNTVIEKIPHMIFVKDAKELRFVKFNKAGQELLGYSLEELAGKNDYDLFPKEQADYFTEKDRAVLRGREVVDIPEEPVQTREMGERIVHTKKIPIFDNAGHLNYLLGISEDITEHKRAAQKLAEALHFNQKIISDASVGIIVFKASGPCVLANEIAARTLGATVPRLLTQNFREVATWHGSGMLKFAEETLATNETRQCEANFTSTFGREVSLVCHFSHFVQNGEPHLLLIFNDVTEKKRLEAQFLRSQRMESIGTLAGGIAHDLNNVLAPLLISVQLLRDRITDDDGRKIIAALESNVNRGADLVKQVLTFGRGIPGERVMIQIKHIALEIKGIIRETFPKSVRLQMEIAPDLWKISGDATQIGQVLLNLCVNARDAMPEGGDLSLRAENAVLDETYTAANLEAKPGRYVVISVADTGMGMTPEVQDRIFEPFFTTKEQGKGTGLGLSTTLAIVKSHGGFIHCYSEPGKGSTFKAYFPVGAAAAPDVETAAAQKPGLPRGHNEMVLVVDDEDPIRNLLKQILERFGYRVLLAVDGVEAV